MSGSTTAAIQRRQVDLAEFIDWSGIECLNQKPTHTYSNALRQGYREDDSLTLESDADEQLLIYLPFTQVVKLHSIVIKGPEEEGFMFGQSIMLQKVLSHLKHSCGAWWKQANEAKVILLNSIFRMKPKGPKTVKLYSNKEHLGFSNVNDYPPSDIAVLSSDNNKGQPVAVKFVKFQNVRSLTIFIEDNQSESEITKVFKIGLYGTTVETTDMKGLKKIEDH